MISRLNENDPSSHKKIITVNFSALFRPSSSKHRENMPI